ncbi:MAG: hypothetical protein GWO24_22840, partial [Akkermansiaceae bacterium]|nr:hypothetical protein [Akkermansiaceae bacterium]
FAQDARVVVLAELIEETREGETWEAVWILIKPSKPEKPVQGVVLASEGDEITIETPDGETETVTVDEEEGDVEPGEVVTVFRGNSDHATGLVRAEEVKNRLERFLDDAEDDVDEAEDSEEGDEEKGKKLDKAADHFDRISGFLNRFTDRQENLLDRVMRGAPEDVKARLQDVKQRIAARRSEHRQRIEDLQNRLDRIHPSNSGQSRPDAVDGPGQGRPDSAGEQSEQGRPSDVDGGKPEGAGQRPEKADKAQDGDRPVSPSSDKGKRGKNVTGDSSGETEEG